MFWGFDNTSQYPYALTIFFTLLIQIQSVYGALQVSGCCVPGELPNPEDSLKRQAPDTGDLGHCPRLLCPHLDDAQHPPNR